jgi:hypothetical protein
MPLDLDKRLANLRRRRVADADGTVAFAKSRFAADSAIARKIEAYQTRAKDRAVEYVLGAMQAVDPEYTKKSIEEGKRVKNQLAAGLSHRVTFEDQGSVPLDIHIKWVSDVDFLVLHADFVRLDWNGPSASTYVKVERNPMLETMSLRCDCEKVLVDKFPAAKVDTTGAKSINISGGSLGREVDVVPAHWFDTADYQRTGQKHDRYVALVDKVKYEMVENRPFMHMKRIDDEDVLTAGGTKKVTRLLKTLRSDSDHKIALSSYDIASLVWHFDTAKMRRQVSEELGLVGFAWETLRYLSANEPVATGLFTPDGSRKILNEPAKFLSLRYLSSDLEEMAIEVARELNPLTNAYPTYIPQVLAEARV